MKLKLVVAVLAAALMVFAGTALADCGKCGHGKGVAAGKGHGACLSKGDDCPGYDTAATKTFKATVISLDKEKCEGCDMTHVDLLVKMNDEKVKIRLGPSWYIDKQDELLAKDDVVEILASKVKHGDQDMFVAGKIVKGEDVLILRDKDGIPKWRGWRRGNA